MCSFPIDEKSNSPISSIAYKMYIGDHPVTDITPFRCYVGCQKVTREQVEQLLKLMKDAEEKLK
jgi:hypothetical protein